MILDVLVAISLISVAVAQYTFVADQWCLTHDDCREYGRFPDLGATCEQGRCYCTDRYEYIGEGLYHCAHKNSTGNTYSYMYSWVFPNGDCTAVDANVRAHVANVFSMVFGVGHKVSLEFYVCANDTTPVFHTRGTFDATDPMGSISLSDMVTIALRLISNNSYLSDLTTALQFSSASDVIASRAIVGALCTVPNTVKTVEISGTCHSIKCSNDYGLSIVNNQQVCVGNDDSLAATDIVGILFAGLIGCVICCVLCCLCYTGYTKKDKVVYYEDKLENTPLSREPIYDPYNPRSTTPIDGPLGSASPGSTVPHGQVARQHAMAHGVLGAPYKSGDRAMPGFERPGPDGRFLDGTFAALGPDGRFPDGTYGWPKPDGRFHNGIYAQPSPDGRYPDGSFAKPGPDGRWPDACLGPDGRYPDGSQPGPDGVYPDGTVARRGPDGRYYDPRPYADGRIPDGTFLKPGPDGRYPDSMLPGPGGRYPDGTIAMRGPDGRYYDPRPYGGQHAGLNRTLPELGPGGRYPDGAQPGPNGRYPDGTLAMMGPNGRYYDPRPYADGTYPDGTVMPGPDGRYPDGSYAQPGPDGRYPDGTYAKPGPNGRYPDGSYAIGPDGRYPDGAQPGPDGRYPDGTMGRLGANGRYFDPRPYADGTYPDGTIMPGPDGRYPDGSYAQPGPDGRYPDGTIALVGVDGRYPDGTYEKKSGVPSGSRGVPSGSRGVPGNDGGHPSGTRVPGGFGYAAAVLGPDGRYPEGTEPGPDGRYPDGTVAQRGPDGKYFDPRPAGGSRGLGSRQGPDGMAATSGSRNVPGSPEMSTSAKTNTLMGAGVGVLAGGAMGGALMSNKKSDKEKDKPEGLIYPDGDGPLIKSRDEMRSSTGMAPNTTPTRERKSPMSNPSNTFPGSQRPSARSIEPLDSNDDLPRFGSDPSPPYPVGSSGNNDQGVDFAAMLAGAGVGMAAGGIVGAAAAGAAEKGSSRRGSDADRKGAEEGTTDPRGAKQSEQGSARHVTEGAKSAALPGQTAGLAAQQASAGHSAANSPAKGSEQGDQGRLTEAHRATSASSGLPSLSTEQKVAGATILGALAMSKARKEFKKDVKNYRDSEKDRRDWLAKGKSGSIGMNMDRDMRVLALVSNGAGVQAGVEVGDLILQIESIQKGGGWVKIPVPNRGRFLESVGPQSELFAGRDVKITLIRDQREQSKWKAMNHRAPRKGFQPDTIVWNNAIDGAKHMVVEAKLQDESDRVMVTREKRMQHIKEQKGLKQMDIGLITDILNNPPAAREYIRRVFTKADDSHKGKIGLTGLVSVCTDVAIATGCPPPGKEDSQRLFDSIDTKHDGAVSFDLFFPYFRLYQIKTIARHHETIE